MARSGTRSPSFRIASGLSRMRLSKSPSSSKIARDLHLALDRFAFVISSTQRKRCQASFMVRNFIGFFRLKIEYPMRCIFGVAQDSQIVLGILSGHQIGYGDRLFYDFRETTTPFLARARPPVWPILRFDLTFHVAANLLWFTGQRSRVWTIFRHWFQRLGPACDCHSAGNGLCNSCKTCNSLLHWVASWPFHFLAPVKIRVTCPPLSGCSSRPANSPPASIAASSACASSALRAIRTRYTSVARMPSGLPASKEST